LRERCAGTGGTVDNYAPLPSRRAPPPVWLKPRPAKGQASPREMWMRREAPSTLGPGTLGSEQERQAEFTEELDNHLTLTLSEAPAGG